MTLDSLLAMRNKKPAKKYDDDTRSFLKAGPTHKHFPYLPFDIADTLHVPFNSSAACQQPHIMLIHTAAK